MVYNFVNYTNYSDCDYNRGIRCPAIIVCFQRRGKILVATKFKVGSEMATKPELWMITYTYLNKQEI